MSDDVEYFRTYMMMRVERERAYAEYLQASTSLELAWVHERAAELASQSEPLETACGLMDKRALAIAAAKYVAFGKKIQP